MTRQVSKPRRETFDIPAEASENSLVMSVTIICRGVYCEDLAAPPLYMDDTAAG